ncbi:Solute carrier family 25 member 45 [Amphibalanus amphitrite]|uniref:Solute carrier family 25 member 45 n=1 Tax=Amphibalanus amphitrite TaxID=1232801 RepID=A0A6A4X7V7_AMPAM|nr:Solute carrier family 25 member 45 [Amphibalanus amphitrite]
MTSVWHELAAGSVGGMAGILVGHPADTIKVRQQTLGGSPLATLRATLKHEGTRGLYKGMAFPLVTNGLLNAIYFGAYSGALRGLDWALGGPAGGGSADRPPDTGRLFVAGCVGGVAQLVVATPVDLVKIQLQTRTEGAGWRAHYTTAARGPLGCLAELYRRRGVRGWYHGLGAMAGRDVASFGLYITLYERASWELRRRAAVSRRGAALLAGGLAGTAAWLSILPLDVIKSKLQADDPARPLYRGVVHCARLTVLRDGPRALFAGGTLLAARAFVVNAVIFLGYECGLEAIHWLEYRPNSTAVLASSGED